LFAALFRRRSTLSINRRIGEMRRNKTTDPKRKGQSAMRRALVFSVLAVACLAGAGLHLSSAASGKVRQLLFSPQAERQATAAPAGGERPAVSVVAASASTADFPIRRYAIGFVSSPAVVDVSARISSEVVSIAVKDGQMVKAGDLLLSLDDRALKAAVERDQATIAKDQAQLVSLDADLQRAKDLVTSQAGTQQAYDQALAAQKTAQANLLADQATLDADKVQLGYANITAPISGRLGAVSVTVGDLVGNNTGNNVAAALVTVTQIDPLRVGFNLPESDLALLQKALASPQAANVTLRRDGDPQPIGKGTLDFVDSSVDVASGTIAARASVPNPELTLWPGQYVDVVLDAGVMPQMTSVPTVAVQSGQKGPFVFVVKPDHTVELRDVHVALTEGENSAIVSGLKSGERVVTEGQTRLTAGAHVREVSGSGIGIPADTGKAASAKVAEDDAAGGKRP
jgi:multidrug efflux system membrane fusion protein